MASWELKQALLESRDALQRAMVKKMFAYALRTRYVGGADDASSATTADIEPVARDDFE